MTRRKQPRRRIEPRLDVPGRGGKPSSASAGARGRAAPSRRPRKKAGSSARSRRRTRRGGGLFGFLKTATYWCVVLGIWAGIAAAGIVLWYGAQMPSMTTWPM